MHSRREFAGARMQTDPDVQTTARDVPINNIANLSLQHFHLPGQGNENLTLFPIDGAKLDGDLEAVLRAFTAPISRHRFHPQKDRLSVPRMSNAELDGHLKAGFGGDLSDIFIATTA